MLIGFFQLTAHLTHLKTCGIDTKTFEGSFQIPQNNLIMFNFSFLYSLAHKENSHHWKVKLAGSNDIFINHRPYRDNNLNKHSVHRGKKQKGKFFGTRLIRCC